jgi:hypothetical protein
MYAAAMALTQICIDSDWNLVRAQAALWDGRFDAPRNRGVSWEQHDVLFLEGADGKLVAAVLVSRDPEWRSKIGFTLIEPGGTSNAQRLETLPTVLARFSAASPNLQPASAKEQR